MITLFLRTSLNSLALGCLVLVSFVSQGKAQSQVLTSTGNSQITEANAAVLFSTGARELVTDGSLDVDMDTFGSGSQVTSSFGTARATFPALTANSSAISVDIQNESGVVIGTFTSSTLENLTLSRASGNAVTAAFTFINPVFTSTDAGTAEIGGGNSIAISISDFEFTGAATFDDGLNPDDFFTNVSNGSFSVDVANLDIFFSNGDRDVIERVGILQSDPNQQFTLSTTTTTLLGDANLDGTVDFLDISRFIAILSAGAFLEEADVNQDSMVTFLDISPFIGILSGS